MNNNKQINNTIGNTKFKNGNGKNGKIYIIKSNCPTEKT